MAAKAKTKAKAKPAEAAAPKPVCFVISPIGEPKSETALRADQTIRHLIRPAAEAQGFEVLRADGEKRPGVITTHIIERLVDSPLVIADLTESNANVFYELAIRHATRKPLVHIVTADQRIPFDVQMMRAVKYDLADPDVLAEAREELSAQIESVKDLDELETPISNFLELKQALESGDSSQVELAELKREVQSLTAEFRSQNRAPTYTPTMPATSMVRPGNLKPGELPSFRFDPHKTIVTSIPSDWKIPGYIGGSQAVSQDDSDDED
jgi:hypothetical protein